MNFKFKKGDACLTCGTRARSVMTGKVVRTLHGRSVEVGWILRRGGRGGALGAAGREGHVTITTRHAEVRWDAWDAEGRERGVSRGGARGARGGGAPRGKARGRWRWGAQGAGGMAHMGACGGGTHVRLRLGPWVPEAGRAGTRWWGALGARGTVHSGARAGHADVP